MKIDIQDHHGRPYSITSRDPETIGRWLIETMATIDLQPGDPPVWFQAWPTWDQATQTADWIMDTRILTVSMTARSPEQMLEAMAGALAQLRDLHNQEAHADGNSG